MHLDFARHAHRQSKNTDEMNQTHMLTEESPKQSDESISRQLRWPVAILLDLAAILKAHQLATSPYVENLIFESRWITAILIVAEVLLAFWIISNWRSSLSRILSICVFVCFFCATAFKVAAGDDSCGCFGVFEVPPIITLVVDAVVLGLLWFWRPSVGKNELKIGLLIAAAVSIAALLIPVFNFSTSSLADTGQIIGDSELIVVDSAEWVGKPLPLVNFIEGDSAYRKGDWEMILYHEDCPVCQRLIQAALSANDGPKRRLFVEIPPYHSPARENQDDLLWCKLSDKHEWFVAAPDVVELSDGVVEASHGQQH